MWVCPCASKKHDCRGKGRNRRAEKRGAESRETFCSLRLWGVCGLWGRSSGKAETAGLSEEKVRDRLSRLAEGSYFELRSRRGREVRANPSRSGLLNVTQGGPSHLMAWVSFGNRTDHL